MNHEEFMREALSLAALCVGDDEVPVGCVITDPDGNIIGRGRNMREIKKSAISHAEIEAIIQACENLGSWRLSDCNLYVTLEPCPMCSGAIINARIKRVFYGAKDEKTGSCGSVINLFMENYGHEPEIVGGILQEECSDILTRFFEKIRSRRK